MRNEKLFRTSEALALGKKGNLLSLSIVIAYEGFRLGENLLSPLLICLTVQVKKESREP
jgi:hypothetical protein